MLEEPGRDSTPTKGQKPKCLELLQVLDWKQGEVRWFSGEKKQV